MILIASELSADLKAALEGATPDLEGIIRRGFTNAAIRRQRISNGCASTTSNSLYGEVIFEDVFLQMDGNNIEINSLRLNNGGCIQPIRVQNISMDLGGMALAVHLDLGTLRLSGDYEIVNPKQLQVLPVVNRGKIDITLEDVKTSGYIGLNIQRDSFTSTNYNLTYSPSGVHIQVAFNTPDGEAISEMTREYVDETVVKSFINSLWLQQEQLIRSRLDEVLSGFSVSEIFYGNDEIIDELNLRNNTMDTFVNKIIDELLIFVRAEFMKSNTTHLNIDNLESTFSKKWGLITFHGDFSASTGRAGILSTIHKVSPFSVVINSKMTQMSLFGELELRELKINYDKYNALFQSIRPQGALSMNIKRNRIFLSITITNVLKPNMKIKLADLRIKELRDIETHVTGLGPLNWMVDLIGKWILGSMWDSIVPLMEQILRDKIESLLEGLLPSLQKLLHPQ